MSHTVSISRFGAKKGTLTERCQAICPFHVACRTCQVCQYLARKSYVKCISIHKIFRKILLIIILHVIKPERSYFYKTTIFKLEIDVVCALYQNTISGMSIILLVFLVHVMIFKTCVDGNPCLMKIKVLTIPS